MRKLANPIQTVACTSLPIAQQLSSHALVITFPPLPPALTTCEITPSLLNGNASHTTYTDAGPKWHARDDHVLQTAKELPAEMSSHDTVAAMQLAEEASERR